jgi:hypothetical protein
MADERPLRSAVDGVSFSDAEMDHPCAMVSLLPLVLAVELEAESFTPWTSPEPPPKMAECRVLKERANHSIYTCGYGRRRGRKSEIIGMREL